MSITAEQKQEIIKKYGRTEGDTGSAEVQVALLTARITNLSDQLPDVICKTSHRASANIFGIRLVR